MNVPVFDTAVTADLDRLVEGVVSAASYSAPTAATEMEEGRVPHIELNDKLEGISKSIYGQINAALQAGKRHLIFYGPPGTGKTTLAEYVAERLSDSGEYEMLTASASWTSQELIGGYQPVGGGAIRFVPGAILRHFDKPMVIDELNRCPIDRAIGPLFSVLSGQSSTLPYKAKVEEDDSPFHVIWPNPKDTPADHEWFPQPRWRLIATLNTVDKSQLGQISYALSRRFAWIKVGVPEDLKRFVIEMLGRQGLLRGAADATLPNPVADMWQAVNDIREVGGAPIIDFIRAAAHMNPAIDFLALPTPHSKQAYVDAFCMFLLPLLDGMNHSEGSNLATALSSAWGLDENLTKLLRNYIQDMVA